MFAFACAYCNAHRVAPHHHKDPVMRGMLHRSHSPSWVGAAVRWLAAVHRQPLHRPNDVVCTLRGGGCASGGGVHGGENWGREGL